MSSKFLDQWELMEGFVRKTKENGVAKINTGSDKAVVKHRSDEQVRRDGEAINYE